MDRAAPASIVRVTDPGRAAPAQVHFRQNRDLSMGISQARLVLTFVTPLVAWKKPERFRVNRCLEAELCAFIAVFQYQY